MRALYAPLRWIVPAALVVWLIGHSALAVDGVFEINQSCATQTGCFPGDVPGVPGHHRR